MTYDSIIIGGGISGLSGAMYAGRLNLRTLVFTEMPGGLITTTHIVENWPGIVSISGPDLAMKLQEHARKSDAEMKNEKVNSVVKNGDLYDVITSSGTYQAKTILFATGTEHRKLDAPGEEEFQNKGVSYCALCDGAFYKDKTVCVVGGGDSAAKEALLLSQFASKVYMIVRKDVLRAEPRNLNLIEKNNKIKILFKTEIAEVVGDGKVTKIKLKNGEEMDMDGVFVAIGHTAQTDLAKGLGVELNEKGEIKVNRHAETNLPGVFAAGDCVDDEFKQAIVGSAEAVVAAFYAYKYIKG
ncbi:FAD-dependent oxidoreductase [Patescibacteria group bacterium]|nr:FAD-dependent oxidoreductase [Patescibacteria group bacterium]